MSILLDSYSAKVGSDNVRPQGNGYNGPCPLCGGSASNGKRSDRFMVWPEKGFGAGERLGKACAEHNIAGVWNCRQCGQSGDTIAFLMEVDGMTFKAACAELKLTLSTRRASPRGTPCPPKSSARSFSPNEWPIKAEDPVKWREYAAKLHTISRESLDQNSFARTWLAERGLDADAIERYQLGYLPGEQDKAGRIRSRSGIGLAPKKGNDGKAKKRIFIPRGIVIPHFDKTGGIIRLRIRRPKQDVEQWGEKYHVLEGSSSQPMLFEAAGARQLAAYVVVESELDAMLVHHATGGIVGVFAALTNRGKPDPTQHQRLLDAASILVALDYDPRQVTKQDGTVTTETAGGIGSMWWQETYKHAKRWPTPTGKDPGEAFAHGVNIREWIALGLPASISLPICGGMEPLSSGLSIGGAGSTENEVFPIEQSSGQTAHILPTSQVIAAIPANIKALAEAWGQVPSLTLQKTHEGGFGFEFIYDHAWAYLSEENWAALLHVQSLILNGSDEWDFVMRDHPNATVTLENLLPSNQ